MKKLIVPCLAIVAFVTLSACAPEEDKRPSTHSSTTTTEETSVHRPSSTTVETTRSY